MKKQIRYIFVVIIFVTVPIYATMIDPMLWEEMAVGCDFAGIVECTTAGGIVAEYKVIEAWKGTQHPETIRIRVAVNYWEPQFPIALIGQQYLVFAYSNKTPSRMVSTTLGGVVPLWWRNIEYDYSLPLFQGRYPIDLRQNISSYDFNDLRKNNKKISIKDIKNGVRELAAKSKQKQEITLLKVLYKKYFLTKYKEKLESTSYRLSGYEEAIDAAKHRRRIEAIKEEVMKYEKLISQTEQLNNEIQAFTDPIQIIDEIFDLSISNYDEYCYSFRSVMGQGIQTTESLEHFKKRIIETTDSEIDDYVRRYLPEGIQVRIGASRAGIHQSAPYVKTYTSKELKKHQAKLKDYKHQDKQKWLQSFDVLAEQQSIITARWLAKWKNPRREWHDKHMGYGLGSRAAYYCKKDKIKCLGILLEAKEPYVRAAGAVYLCFEDEKKGVKQLKKMQKIRGNPGLWASLNLARRGDKHAMDKMVKEFLGLSRHDSGMVLVPHRNLMKRTLVLLSNSAEYSHVPQPPHDLYDANITTWWKKYKKQITLHDPWLDILKKQKVD